MKKIFVLIVITILSFHNIFAQIDNKNNSPQIDTIDVNDLNIFLYPRVNFPRDVYLNDENNSVTFTFKILTNGEIDSIKILKSNSKIIENEIIRVLNESSGKWTPAIKNGKPINSTIKYTLGAGLSWTKKKANKYLNNAKKNETKSNYKKAIKYYKKLLILIPNNSETIIDIAKNYFLLDDRINGCKILNDCQFDNCKEFKDKKCE